MPSLYSRTLVPSGYRKSYTWSFQTFTYALSVGIFDYAKAGLIDSLDCAVREDAFFTAICVQALDRAVWKVDLLVSIGEVLLDLFVLELENLQAIWVSRLGGSRFSEEIDRLALAVSLFDVLVREPNNLVTVRPHLSFNSVCKHNFFFAVRVDALELSIAAARLLDHIQAGEDFF